MNEDLKEVYSAFCFVIAILFAIMGLWLVILQTDKLPVFYCGGLFVAFLFVFLMLINRW